MLGRKGLLRMHCFETEDVLFLGKDQRLYMAKKETNAETGEEEAKMCEIFYGNRPWESTGTRKHGPGLVMTGTKEEAA